MFNEELEWNYRVFSAGDRNQQDTFNYPFVGHHPFKVILHDSTSLYASEITFNLMFPCLNCSLPNLTIAKLLSINSLATKLCDSQ